MVLCDSESPAAERVSASLDPWRCSGLPVAPRRTDTISLITASAISSGVAAPRSSPAGARTRSSFSRATPDTARKSSTSAARCRLEIIATYGASLSSAFCSQTWSALCCVAMTIKVCGPIFTSFKSKSFVTRRSASGNAARSAAGSSTVTQKFISRASRASVSAMRPCPTISSSGRGSTGSMYTSITPPQGIPTPSSSSVMSSVINCGRPLARQVSASDRTVLSAQPPPTHPATIFPSALMIACEPVFAEDDPSTRTTVATANGSFSEASSSALRMTSMDMALAGIIFSRPQANNVRAPATLAPKPMNSVAVRRGKRFQRAPHLSSGMLQVRVIPEVER